MSAKTTGIMFEHWVCDAASQVLVIDLVGQCCLPATEQLQGSRICSHHHGAEGLDVYQAFRCLNTGFDRVLGALIHPSGAWLVDLFFELGVAVHGHRLPEES